MTAGGPGFFSLSACSERIRQQLARVDHFFGMLRFDPAVDVSQFLEIAAGFLKQSAPNFAEPVEAIVVRGGRCG
jgi:hypothetical protein